MRSRLTVVTIAATCLLITVGSALADDDKKSLPGVACKPESGLDLPDFEWKSGALVNLASSRRTVECPLLRDNFSGNGGNELDEVRIHVRIDSSATKSFKCTVFARSLVTGAVLDKATASVPPNPGGNKTIVIGNLDGGAGLDYGVPGQQEEVSVNVKCLVCAGCKLRGLYWSEDLETDFGEGE